MKWAPVFLMLWCAPALAQDMRGNGMFVGPVVGPNPAVCPSDKPIRKTVDTGFGTCTLMACIGRLVCPPSVSPGDPECFRAPAKDCNTCTRTIVEICLSQDELERAR